MIKKSGLIQRLSFLVLASLLFINCSGFKPLDLRITEGGLDTNARGSITLQWDANPEEVLGYRLYYGYESGNYLQPFGQGIDLGLTSNPSSPIYVVTDLEIGRTYYFAVTAYNSLGEGPYSVEVSGVVQAPQ